MYAISVFIVGALGAAVLQQPLQDTTDLRQCIEFGLDCSPGTPVANPCFTAPGPSDPELCLKINGTKTLDRWLAAQPAGYFYSNWASCQALNQTCAMPLGAESIYQDKTCFKGSVPDEFVTVRNASDVQKGLEYARQSGKSLVIKNSGHDWKGRSAGPESIALWTHHLKFPMVLKNITTCTGEEETIVQFGAGEKWAEVYKFAHEQKHFVLGGTCGTVGPAGWLQGGGHSPMTPHYGMGTDNIIEFEIVLANGSVKIANECDNKDLFFAVRGGGGGTYGVLTNMTYRAVPEFPLQDLTVNLTMLGDDKVSGLFDVLTENGLDWASSGWGGYIKINKSIDLVNPDMDANDMEPLIDYLSKSGLPRPKIEVRKSWFDYYNIHLKDPKNHIGGWSGAVASRLMPESVFPQSKSDRRLSNELGKIYASNFEHTHTTNLSMWVMLVTPTVFLHNDSALHPKWKDAVWSVRVNDLWSQYKDVFFSAENNARFQRVHESMNGLRKLAPDSTVSISEADIWEVRHDETFWGKKNHDRLLAIKQQVDPQNLFSNYMAVNWNKGDERYKCYPKQLKT